MQASNSTSADLSIIVPAYNEAANIEPILNRLRSALPEAEIIVVNDGSNDATGEIADQLANSRNICVLHQATNSGKGAAVKHGLAHATRPWVVIQDADLEYDPEDLQQLLERAATGIDVAVYGSRYQTRGHASGGAWLNYVGVKLLAVLEWILYGQWLSDPHTCYKMIRRDVLDSMDIQSQGFELCAEINSKLLRAGNSIIEIPVDYTPRNAAGGKKIRLRDFFIAVWTYLRYRFGGKTSTAGSDSTRPSSALGSGYLISRMSIGCLLLIAAAMKLSPLSALPIAIWLVVPKTAMLIWGIAEFVLGWACLTMVPHRLLNQVLIALFTVFLLVLAIKWIGGEERCECLGSLSLPLGIMAILDGILLASLIFLRQSWQRVWGLRAGFFDHQTRNLMIVLPALLLACVAWFGSLDAARCYFAGNHVLVDSFSKFAGDVKQNDYVDVIYTLSNPTSAPVRVLGAKASCSCIAILDLPTTVEPGSEKAIRLRVKGIRADTLQRESAELFFDDSALRMVLNATAVVRPNH